MLNQIVNRQDENVSPVTGLNLCFPEAPAYPAEFLSIIKDTGFEALKDLLKKIDAPKDALELLDDLAILATIGNIRDGEQVSALVNQILGETVASASRNISKIGGIFYGPSGTTISREVDAGPDQD